MFSASLVNMFSIRFGRYHSPTTSVNPGPKIVVLDAFTAGVTGRNPRHSTRSSVPN